MFNKVYTISCFDYMRITVCDTGRNCAGYRCTICFSIVMYGMPAMIILVCGSIAFADSLCEDLEQKYVLQQIIRGDLGKYVTARV